MTYREQMALAYQNKVDDELFFGGVAGCPSDKVGSLCAASEDKCRACWDREMPVENTIENAVRNLKTGVACIKDSGDRTEFATGAVRDMREGKGRCDLMPLDVVAEYLMLAGIQGMYNKKIVKAIADFQHDNITHHLYMAIGHFVTDAYDKSDITMLLEVAKHFEEGAKKYGENNWQKGIPVHCYIDSAVRHYLKWLRGDKDEPHDRAFVWNLMCCIWEVDYSPRAKEEK